MTNAAGRTNCQLSRLTGLEEVCTHPLAASPWPRERTWRARSAAAARVSAAAARSSAAAAAAWSCRVRRRSISSWWSNSIFREEESKLRKGGCIDGGSTAQ